MKKIIFLLILLSQISIAWAQQSFVVRNIRVEGLQRVSQATVENYLLIKRGQTLRPEKTAEILRNLYKTGFFESVTLSKEDGTLVIHVTERPTIGQLKITGNYVIPTDKLNSVMKSLDIAEGRIYNPAMLEKITQGLLNQYYQLGRYNARVDARVTPMSRNRVMVNITISEGLVAKIRRITIIGNHAFSERTLLKQMDMTTSGLLTFFTQSDRYSEARLDESAERLRAFYLDHGYIHVEIKSAQAEVTPDRKSVYITIAVEEGPPYTVKGYEIAGNSIFSQEEYLKRITIRPGETFSRQKIIDSEKSITTFLGEKGYMFATISLRPQVNDETRQVVLVFDVKPGKRAYIRHITFSDNMRTNDVVLRREMEQLESAPASTTKLNESKHRLSLLPYIKDVDMSLKPVPDVDDQVDVNYRVKEDNSAQASVKLGYSQIYRFSIGAGLNQKNFLGTGNTLGINLNRSKYEQFYGIDYTDPYYTEDGISRQLSFAISRVDPSGVSRLNSGYATNEYDLGVLYGIPIGQEIGAYNRILAGVSYQNILVNLNRDHPNMVSNQVNSFINRHGRRYQELDLRVGYSRNSLDRAIFPTCGMFQTLFLDLYAPLSRGSLSFYTLNYQGKWYQPLTDQFIFLTRLGFGYGNGLHGIQDFPFFKNFYAGGIDTVRGYQGFTLGPLDSNGQNYGGNILADANLSLIFPNYISDNLRTSVFVDAGNVYTSLNNRQFGGQSTMSGPIRYSTGIEVDWLTPFGPIELSLAKAFSRPHDKIEPFQFALGANF